MDRSHTLFILTLSIAGGLPTLILFDYFKGADPYYFLTQSTFGQPILFHLIGWGPRLLQKITPITFLLATATLTYYIAKTTNHPPKLTTILTFTSGMLLYRANIIEDDLPGLLLMLITIYFFLQYQETKKTKYLLGITTPLIIGIFTWKGILLTPILIAIYYLYKKNYKIFAYGLTGAAIWKAVPNIPKLLTNGSTVSEHSLGLPHLAFMNLFLLFGLFTPKKHDFIHIWTIFFTGLAILSAQYVWLVAIPLALKTSTYVKKLPEQKKTTFIVAALFLSFFTSTGMLIRTAPQPETIKFTKQVTTLTRDRPINNSWELGYYLKYYHGNPVKWGSRGPPKKNVSTNYKIVRNQEKCLDPIFNTTRYYFCRS